MDDACVMPGGSCTDDGDCEEGETCEPLVARCVPVPEEAGSCTHIPPPGRFEPVVEWEALEGDSIATPLVVQLTDDDGDGTVGAADTPDVVANVYTERVSGLIALGRLVALSGEDGSVLWRSAARVRATNTPAAGDLDGDGAVEIVLTGEDDRLVVYGHDGELERTGVTAPRYGAYAIADLEADGTPEIIGAEHVFENDGTQRFVAEGVGSIPTVADLDLDGALEIAGPSAAWNHDGTRLWEDDTLRGGYTAVGRVIEAEASAGPQVVAVDDAELVVLDGATGDPVFGPVTFGARAHPSIVIAATPTIADFDGDDRPEIGLAGGSRFIVFDPELPPPHELWSLASEDVTSGTVGSTVFDFDADGSAEVLYADECHLRILSGRDGSLLWSAPSSSATSFEYPVVADVDRDGNAEVVVVSNEPGFDPKCGDRSLPWSDVTPGIRVYGDALDNWVATRTIWNQHTYHIDNVTEDGRVPSPEARSWESHNTYRLNAFLDPERAVLAPDVVVASYAAEVSACPSVVTLRARIENRGARGVAAGVPVAFFAGRPPDRSALLGVALTTKTNLAGTGEWVSIEATDLPRDDARRLQFYAVVDDDGTGAGVVSECLEDNNTGPTSDYDCSGPI